MINQAVAEIKAAGFDCFTTSLGGPGVAVTRATANVPSSLGNDSSNIIKYDTSTTNVKLADVEA